MNSIKLILLIISTIPIYAGTCNSKSLEERESIQRRKRREEVEILLLLKAQEEIGKDKKI